MTRSKPFPLWPIFTLAGLLLLAWLGLKVWRINQAAQSLLAKQTEVETLLANGPTQVDPETAESLLTTVRANLLTIKTETAVFLPLLPALDWIPTYGPTIAAAPALLDMADAGTETAVYAFRGLKPALALLQTENSSSTSRIADLVAVLDAAEPDLLQANMAFEQFMAARQTVGDPTNLNWRVRDLLARVDPLLPIAQDGLQVALVLPELLGSQGARRYLIMAQNEDEMRPTGGFLTGIGMITVENGRILDLTLQDANYVDDWANKPYDVPPQPLYELMGLDMFLTRDANFWPDFPTSAEKAMQLYSYGQNVPEADGAIAIDQRFLQLLLQATGPVFIPDANTTVDSQTIISAMQTAWAPTDGEYSHEWLFDRKAFLSTFATAIRTKIETDFSSIDPLQFTQNLFEAVQTKHLQIYVRDPVISAVFQTLQWDGRFPATAPQDFLMVVDTNMSFGKSNLYIQRQARYHVTLAEAGAQAHLQLTYQHTAPDNGQPCVQYLDYDDTPTYTDIANRCYWDYLRVYAPANSQLLDSSQHTIPGESLVRGQTLQNQAQTVQEVAGYTTFSNFFLLPRSQTLTTFISYQLPPQVVQNQQYQLLLFKQAGTQAQPWQIVVTLPENKVLTSALPPPTSVEGNTLTWELQMDTNMVLTVNYGNSE